MGTWGGVALLLWGLEPRGGFLLGDWWGLAGVVGVLGWERDEGNHEEYSYWK